MAAHADGATAVCDSRKQTAECSQCWLISAHFYSNPRPHDMSLHEWHTLAASSRGMASRKPAVGHTEQKQIETQPRLPTHAQQKRQGERFTKHLAVPKMATKLENPVSLVTLDPTQASPTPSLPLFRTWFQNSCARLRAAVAHVVLSGGGRLIGCMPCRHTGARVASQDCQASPRAASSQPAII